MDVTIFLVEVETLAGAITLDPEFSTRADAADFAATVGGEVVEVSIPPVRGF